MDEVFGRSKAVQAPRRCSRSPARSSAGLRGKPFQAEEIQEDRGGGLQGSRRPVHSAGATTGATVIEPAAAGLTDLCEEHGRRGCGEGSKIVLVRLPRVVSRGIDRAAGGGDDDVRR
jgi:hypothetical protein